MMLKLFKVFQESAQGRDLSIGHARAIEAVTKGLEYGHDKTLSQKDGKIYEHDEHAWQMREMVRLNILSIMAPDKLSSEKSNSARYSDGYGWEVLINEWEELEKNIDYLHDFFAQPNEAGDITNDYKNALQAMAEVALHNRVQICKDLGREEGEIQFAENSRILSLIEQLAEVAPLSALDAGIAESPEVKDIYEKVYPDNIDTSVAVKTRLADAINLEGWHEGPEVRMTNSRMVTRQLDF